MKVDLHGVELTVENDKRFWNEVKQWEPETFEIVKRYASQEKAFIDIGAWNGVVSLFAANHYNSVFSVEPDVVAFEKLLRNIELNGLLNVSAKNVAVSNTNGSTILNIADKGDSMSSLIPRHEGFSVTNQVQTVETETFESLISFLKKPIGLIKMDIEGGELLVIPEMLEYLEANRPPLYVSFHPFWFPEEEKGYQILWFAEALFAIYLVVRDAQFNEVTKEQFIEGMNDNSFTYVFDTK